MHYLTVNGLPSGMGIRDSLAGGYIEPQNLELSAGLVSQIKLRVKRSEQAHYFQFNDKEENESLDQEGIEICRLLRVELPDKK